MSTELGKYKPYSEYKYSGVKWLGDVPTLWSISRLKYLPDYHRTSASFNNRAGIAGV